ncbi:MAG: family 43 glycosylhydrolase [Lachnospiraceae bacterium]
MEKMKEHNYTPWIAQRADPYVTNEHGGKYYFTASVPEYDRIVLRCADNLEDLKNADEKTIWTKHESGEMSCHIWAPELHYLFGNWYIYFAAGERDDIWKIRPYVLKCEGEDPMKDPWTELGKMKRSADDKFSFEAFSLDATVFESCGQWYFIWAEKVGVGDQISNLYIAKMESANTLSTAQVLLSTPDYDWERHGFWVNEGPGVLKHNGKIFLTFSASDTSPAYCVGMLIADENADLIDPKSWEKLRYPVLKSKPECGLYGPGHNSFTKDEVGNDIIVYHARTTDKLICENPLYDPNRHTMKTKIVWNEEDMPVF